MSGTALLDTSDSAPRSRTSQGEQDRQETAVTAQEPISRPAERIAGAPVYRRPPGSYEANPGCFVRPLGLTATGAVAVVAVFHRLRQRRTR